MTTIEFSSQLQKLDNVLIAFAIRLTKDREEANDLYQETASRAFKHRQKFQVNSNFRAWMVTIMRNIFINQYRRKKVRKIYTEPLDDCMYALESSGISNSGEENMMMSELEGVIGRLDDTFSIPFIMHYQGYRYEEIAEKMNIPLGTVKSRIFFARQRLRKEVEALYL